MQSKSDNTQTFNRTWQAMKNQINTSNCFWIGLERLHQITSTYSCRLDIYMNNGSSVLHAAYSAFSVGDESTDYKLSLAFESNRSDVLDALGSQTGQSFSTFDNDNDSDSAYNCALKFGAGWWFGSSGNGGTSCGTSDLNCFGSNYRYSKIPEALRSDQMYMTCI